MEEELKKRMILVIGTHSNPLIETIAAKCAKVAIEFCLEQNQALSMSGVVGRSEQLTAFNEWLDDNHHSFKIPDMILQDYIRYGG